MTAATLRPFTVVEDILRRLVAANPDNKPKSVYFNRYTGEPVCGVGNVMAELGAHRHVEDDYAFVVNAAGDRVVREGQDASKVTWNLLGIENPNVEQVLWVQTFQDYQDGGRDVWAEALAIADTERAGAQA